MGDMFVKKSEFRDAKKVRQFLMVLCLPFCTSRCRSHLGSKACLCVLIIYCAWNKELLRIMESAAGLMSFAHFYASSCRQLKCLFLVGAFGEFSVPVFSMNSYGL